MNYNVAEIIVLNDLQQHVSFDLIEPFLNPEAVRYYYSKADSEIATSV